MPRSTDSAAASRGAARRAPSAAQHAIAIGAAAVALVIARALSPWLDTYTVLPSILAVVVAAWFGGLGPGLLATGLSAAGILYLLVPPPFSFALHDASADLLRVGMFALSGTGVSVAIATLAARGEALRVAREAERTARELAEQHAAELARANELLQEQAVELEQRADEEQALARRLQASIDAVAETERRLHLLVEGVRDYAIFMLDPDGTVRTWNTGAARIKGYAASEIIGTSFARFYPPEELAAGKPQRELEIAAGTGRYEEEGWRVRKDGTRFWASVVLSAVRDERGTLVGYAKVTRDLTERRRAEQGLLAANRELAATTYTIAHDLRSPLRAIDGYSRILELDHAGQVGEEGRALLSRIRANAQRMGELIDGVLSLARIGRGDLQHEAVDLSAIARAIVEELRRLEPHRAVDVHIAPSLVATGDRRLLTLVIQNLLGNAWKFTRPRERAIVEVSGGHDGRGMCTFVVRDNGVGFDPEFRDKLFGPFQRLHRDDEFEGNGIGLATVRRVVERHGGRVWAEGAPGAGAVIHVALPAGHGAGIADVHPIGAPAGAHADDTE